MSLKDPVLARILAILAGVNAIGLAVARYVLPQLVPEFVPSAAILSVLLVVSLGIVLYFVRRELSLTFEELLGSIRRIAAGNFDMKVRLAPNTSHSLQLLADALNDMTSQYREAMAEAEANRIKLSGITATMIDGLIIVDQELRIILSNPAARSLLGVDPDVDLEGQDLLSIVRNYDLIKAFNEALGEKAVSVQEVNLFTPSQRIMRAHATPITDERGNAVGVATILHDVTELKRLEQMRSDFVANVSHELRTPLTSIKGFVETLSDGAAEDPEGIAHFLPIIARETDRMVAIVNDLLKLSKIEASNEAWKPEPVNLRQVLENSIATCGPQATAKNITIHRDIPPELPPVAGDEQMLHQVFINLIDNGVKYTEAGGSVWVNVIETTAKEIVVEIADNGVGIAAKHLPRVFERFYRVDKGRSRGMGGTGLGLAIVKHIVERHKGTISVESELGEGTAFTVTLPRAE